MAKNYVIQIIVDMEDKGVRAVVQGVEGDLQNLGDTTESVGGRMAGALQGAAIAMAFGQAIPLVQKSIAAYNDLRRGMVGLRSIVKFTGEDWDAALGAVKEYTKDGLIPLSQATTGLKNLLLRGYGLERSIELLYRLKDAAAYGRQGSLTLGQAIMGATEGLKNMNPMLVDNAGVTKNMSKMWEEYAKSLGTTSAKLTDQQRIEAEYHGIMKETLPMLGNAGQLTDELAGKQAALDAQLRELKETVGAAVAPAYEQILEKMDPVIAATKRFAQANPALVATILGGAGLVAAVSTLAVAFSLMGVGGAIIVGVAVAIIGLAAGIVKLKTVLMPANEALVAHADAAEANVTEIAALRREYDDLAGKPAASAEEHERLLAVMEALAEKVPEATAAFDAEGRVMELNLSALDNYIAAQTLMREYYIEKLEQRQTEKVRALTAAQRELTIALGVFQGATKQASAGTDEFADAQTDATAMIADATVEERFAAMSKDQLREAIVLLSEKIGGLDTDAEQLTQTIRRLRGEIVETGDTVKDVVDDLTPRLIGAGRSISSYWERVKDLAMLEWGPAEEWKEVPGAIDEADGAASQYFENRRREQEEALARFQESFRGKLAAMGKDWATWEQGAVRAVSDAGNAIAGFLAYSVSGNQEALEQLKAAWGNFFQWLVEQTMMILVKWLIGKVLMSLGLPLGAGGKGGFDIIGMAPGTQLGAAGGKVMGRLTGRDSVPVWLMPGELVTNVDTTRRLESLLADYTGRVGRPTMPVFDDLEMATPGGGTAVFNIYAVDAKSLRDMIRNGPLGKELAQAALLNQMPGPAVG